jgi:hypothetical protein
VTASATAWVAAGVVAAILIAGSATGFLLLAMGRLGLDLDWGRSRHELGPIVVDIDAPRELVFEILEAPYVGRARAEGIEVLDRGEDLVVASHLTKVHFYTARTVEVIGFERPARIRFRHLHGPVPHAVEAFELTEQRGRTSLRYSGELGIDFFVLGRIAGRRWVVPQWERVVRTHLDDVGERATARAARGPKSAA